MIQCQNCRKNNPDGNEYCGHCGGKLVQSNPQATERKYPPGKEPEEIKRLLKTFLAELHREFPDHIIDYSIWNHEKWDKLAKYLCKQLEYKGLVSMLRAYGFRIKRDAPVNGSVPGSTAAERQSPSNSVPEKSSVRKPRHKKSNNKWYVTIAAVVLFVVGSLIVLRSCSNKPHDESQEIGVLTEAETNINNEVGGFSSENTEIMIDHTAPSLSSNHIFINDFVSEYNAAIETLVGLEIKLESFTPISQNTYSAKCFDEAITLYCIARDNEVWSCCSTFQMSDYLALDKSGQTDLISAFFAPFALYNDEIESAKDLLDFIDTIPIVEETNTQQSYELIIGEWEYSYSVGSLYTCQVRKNTEQEPSAGISAQKSPESALGNDSIGGGNQPYLDSIYMWQDSDVFSMFYDEKFSDSHIGWEHLGINGNWFYLPGQIEPTWVDVYRVYESDGSSECYYVIPYGEIQMTEVYYSTNGTDTELVWSIPLNEYYEWMN